MTSSASAIAYKAIPDLEDRQRKVLQCIARHPHMSYRDVARATGMDRANVKSRITELLKQGRIEISGHKRDRTTKRMVRQYRAVV